MLISNGRFLFVPVLLSCAVTVNHAAASDNTLISLDADITDTIRKDTLDKIGLHTEEYQKSLDIIEETIESYLNKKKLTKKKKQKLTYVADTYNEYNIKGFSPANWNWVMLQEYVKYAVLHYTCNISDILRFVEAELLKQEKMKEYTSAIQRARQDMSVYMGSGYGALINAYRRIDLTEKSAKAKEKSNNNFIKQTLEFVSEITEGSVHKRAEKIYKTLTDKKTDDELKKNFCLELSFNSLVKGAYGITRLASNQLHFEEELHNVWKEFQKNTDNTQDSNLMQNKEKFFRKYVEKMPALPVRNKGYFETCVYSSILELCNDFYNLLSVEKCAESAKFMERILERSEKIRSDFLIRLKNFYLIIIFDLLCKPKQEGAIWLDTNEKFAEYYRSQMKSFVNSKYGKHLTALGDEEILLWAQTYTDAMKIDDGEYALTKFLGTMATIKEGSDDLVAIYKTATTKNEINTKMREILRRIIASQR